MKHVDLLRQAFPHLTFIENEPLAQYSRVKIGGPADIFCQLSKREDIKNVVIYANSRSIPFTILGWGANSLIADSGIRGLVIRNMSQDITIHEPSDTSQAITQNVPQHFTPRWEASDQPEAPSTGFSDLNYGESNAEKVLVTLDSGVSLQAAINVLLSKGITGLQWFSRIPASIGGAIYNNIHGGTRFIGEFLSSVEVISEHNQVQKVPVDQLHLDYDFSRFHGTREVILSADFLLTKGDVDKARAVSVEWARRKQVQPENSLGCVFQNITQEEQERLNLPTPSTGYLIQHVLQLQGFRVGDAQISYKHAAFIENVGSATASDYIAVIKKIITAAQEQCNLTLKTEIFFLGFTDDQLEGIVHSRST